MKKLLLATCAIIASASALAQIGPLFPGPQSSISPPLCTPNTQGGGADGNVMVLLHFDNNGTDNALPPHNLTLFGGANYSATQSKFGGYALNIVTAGTSYAQQANGLVVGTGNLTLEGWVYWPTSPTYFGMLGDDQATNMSLMSNPNLTTQIGGTFATFTPTMPSAISANTWHHLAFTRTGGSGVSAFYLDGVAQVFSSGVPTAAFGSATSGLKMGRAYSATYTMPANSYIDEVRISNNIRYTANFTPQVTPFCNPVPPSPSSTYRYWRLNISSSVGSTYARIAEWTMNVGGVNQIPLMTSNTTSGVTISSAGTQGSGFEEFRAADRNITTDWYSGPSGATFLEVDLGSAVHIDTYSVQSINVAGIGPAAWTLQGSNDNSFWFTIDTQTGQTWTASQLRSYTPPPYP
jgi:Concanavalin A-like lectin/glucanases superfamily